MRISPALLAVFLAASSFAAETPATPDLQWLAGHWCSRKDTRTSEEYWLPAHGGLMLGVNRSVGKRTSFEFMRIELTNGARFIGQPGGDPPTTFELLSSAPNKVSFANPQHDFPKRVHYWREGDVLSARVDDGTDTGQTLNFTWQRCGAPASLP